jgi:hypothetical protein
LSRRRRLSPEWERYLELAPPIVLPYCSRCGFRHHHESYVAVAGRLPILQTGCPPYRRRMAYRATFQGVTVTVDRWPPVMCDLEAAFPLLTWADWCSSAVTLEPCERRKPGAPRSKTAKSGSNVARAVQAGFYFKKW